MALCTLQELKDRLKVTGTAQDASLTMWLRDACDVIRAYTQFYLGGVISAYTVANPTIVTAIGHGLETGDTILVAHSAAGGTSIDGSRVVTWISEDTFSIPVDVTVAGTGADFARTYTEYYAGKGTPELILRQRPVLSVGSIYEDAGAYYGDAAGAFAAATALTAGIGYAFPRGSGGVGEAGLVLRVGGVWPAGRFWPAGMLSAAQVPGLGNIKVTYTAGFTRMPNDIKTAVAKIVGELRAAAGKAGDMQSESLDFYSYSRMSAAEQAKMVTGLKSLLGKYKQWAI